MGDEQAVDVAPGPMFDQADSLESLIFMGLGAASACWEHLDRAGVFESDRCKRIGDEVLREMPRFLPGSAVMARVDPEAFGLGPSAADDAQSPRLGLASTGQLLSELQARIETDQVVGRGHPIKNADAMNAVSHVRHALTGEQLAYRTVD